MPTRTAFIFDLDGTLIDSEPVWKRSIHAALAERDPGIRLEEIQALHGGMAWPDLFEKVIRPRWPHCYPDRISMEEISESFFQRFIANADIAIAGSRRLLCHLAGLGYPVAIVSGSTRKQVAEAIALLRIDSCIRTFVACEDVSQGKPAPDGFLLGAQWLQTDPENCIVFEDKAIGVQAAKAAGMRCALLQRPELPPQSPDLADWVLTDLADFPGIFPLAAVY